MPRPDYGAWLVDKGLVVMSQRVVSARTVHVLAGVSRRLGAVGVGVLGVVLAALGWQGLSAQAPDGFVDVPVVTDIWQPTQLAMAPDGRLLVIRDSGIAEMIKNDVRLTTPFLDISDRVNTQGDRGMLSMAFDNDFAVNGYVYVVYVHDDVAGDADPGNVRLSRFTATGDVAPSNTEVVIFDDFPVADVELHYGGGVEHGSDGKLYVTVGDYLIGPNAQDNTNLKGTVLRLNTDGSIPTDNPFYAELTGVNRAIYANGLRNPWQTQEHPVTGEIFISDVGANVWEELNVLEAGGNYGWRIYEGPEPTPDPDFVDPLWAFPHLDAAAAGTPIKGCAIVGGDFYETPVPTFPAELRGKFFTADYCTGQIVSVDTQTGAAEPFMTLFDAGDAGVSGLVDFAVSPINGDLYYLDRVFKGDGTFPKGGVGKISYVGDETDITIGTQPSDVSIAVGEAASFFVGASAPGDVTYQWYRDGVAIAGEVSPRLVIDNVSAADAGASFTVVISNGVDSVTSDPATITLSNNTVPVPQITVEPLPDGYTAGVPVAFSGSAVDAEDGAIPDADLRWEIRLNHDDHDHALANGIVGDSGSFAVPPAIETDTNVWLTLYLTATDSDGTSSTVSARVDPLITTVTLATSPGGLDVTFEGQTLDAPYSFDSVAGVLREISAPATQTAGGTTYLFDSWSDGRARDEVRPTGGTDETLTATYTTTPPADGCTVETRDAGGVLVQWENLAGTENLRFAFGKNGGDGWVATPPSGTTEYVDLDGHVDFGYYIRRSGDIPDEVCTPLDDGPVDPPGDVCVVDGLAAGGVEISWDDLPGDEQIRFQTGNNGGDGWVATAAPGSTSYVDGDGDVSYGYYIRRSGVNEICEIGDTPPPVGPTCQVTENAGGGVFVDWDDVPGENRYAFRVNGGWIQTVQNASELVYGPGSLADSYVIRYNVGNGPQSIPCTNIGEPPPVEVCTATAIAGGVRIDFENRPGTEQIRYQFGNNGGDGWVATAPAGSTSYVDSGGDVADGYYVRRSGVDEICD